jgi:hypothetical protein
MLRNEASIRELFYRSCTADRSFVPQDDRKMGYLMGNRVKAIRELFYRRCMSVNRFFTPFGMTKALFPNTPCDGIIKQIRYQAF